MAGTLHPNDLVDPAFFSRLDDIELRAQAVVEGFLHGLHRSPFVGFSVEFNSHREYVPGDDLRHVNWKLYARQQRLYVKEYDAETNMNVYIMLDISQSMECANTGQSKFQYGAALAAAIAHLALKQHDAVGITLFSDRVVSHLRPSAKPHQLQEILHVITSTPERSQSDVGRAFHQAAELTPHRGMIVLISDLFDDVSTIMEGIEHLQFKNHEVVLFHVLDRWERDLPLDGNVRFTDMETGEEITAQADGIREQYLQHVNDWLSELAQGCLNRGVQRVELTTDEPLDKALLDYFVKRAKAQ